MNKEVKPNPEYLKLKPEDEGVTWWKLEDIMPCLQANAYKEFNIGPPPKKDLHD